MPARKQFGGVRVTFARVAPASNLCPGCGRTDEECAAWWDAELKITGHAADTGQKSEYVANLRKMRAAAIAGRDPYCFRATLQSHGYVSHWTPYLPAGSFAIPPLTTEATHGTGPKNPRAKRGRGPGRTASRKP